MSAPPKTILDVSAAEEEAIRTAVRQANLGLLGPYHRLATAEHVDGLIELLSDPAVSEPIYDLPRPFTRDMIGNWVREARVRQEKGEAVLCVMLDEAGALSGYSYFTVWPDCSAAEIAGAHRADMQSHGVGKAGAARSFGWMFEHLGVRLIGLTAAKDNVRSAKVIEAAGFVPMGERSSLRPDGTVRESRYWEMTRDQWRARHTS